MRFGPVVQLVRTLACHARGRGFEPHPGRQFTLPSAQRRCSCAFVAQLVEQRTENPRVVGSIPTEGTISAGLAHLVERHLAKVEVASSSLVTRSRKNPQESPVGAVFEDFSFAEIFLRKLEIHDAL